MSHETQDNHMFNDKYGSQNSEQLSMNYSPIKTQDSRFMDLSPAETIFNDRPPRFYQKNGDLRSVEEIPTKYRNLFETFRYFNLVQSRVMDNALYSDRSLVVAAPTGSGKTTIFELAIVRLMMAMEDLQYKGDFKIVYMAPIKSLCSERLCDWNKKFSEIGLSCIEVTGDTDRLEFKALENYKIIITTPEKWDSITRKWKDNKEIVRVVKLFLIDEIHLLNDRKRGPTLEAVVSRMKIIQKSIEYELKQKPEEYNNYDELMKKFFTHIRFVALSATIKNIEDIGQWLGDKTKRFISSSAIIQEFGEEFRPVQLNKIVLGYMCPSNSTPFKFDLSLNYKLKSIIEEYSNNKPTLVFCTTRKGLITTAEVLCKSLTFRFSENQKEFIRNSLREMRDKKLKEMLEVGIGWHHAGMDCNDRYIVEQLFRAGVVPVLLTTSTLSMGVNLPAHLVIIKSTEMYQSNGYENYSQIALQQMIGRAGRPQYDTSATAVIMTKVSMQKFYENMIMGTEIIESNLHKYLGEHLNAEIVLRTITDLVIALDWLKTTFLYVRVLKNPRYYGLTQPSLTPEKIETKLIELCQIEINKLRKLKLVKTDSELGVDLQPTRNGELMAQYYLTFSTMQLFLKINGTETLNQLINMISDSDEFSEIRLRVTDKKILNTLNKCKFSETIRFPLPGRISNLSMKVNCIIQAVFGALPIHESSLRIESDRIMKIGERISHCLCQYLLTQDKGFVALRNALILSQCFEARLWENSKYISRQFERIGPVTANLLASAGKITFNDILNSNPRDLERICNRGPPFGNNLINFVNHLPKFSLRIIPPDVAASPPRYLTAILEFSNFDDLQNMTTTGKNHAFCILLGDSSNNILFYKKYRDEDVLMIKTLTHQVKLVQTNEHEVFGCVISETWVGLNVESARKMPPINHYLINAFKKYENSELNKSKTGSNPIEEIHTQLSQLKQDALKLDEKIIQELEKNQSITNKHNVEELENLSELDTSNDVLNQIISSVFDNKSSFTSNDVSLKQQSINSSRLSTDKNHKDLKILATVTPYMCDKHLNETEMYNPVPKYTSQKQLLVPDSPNNKHYYENKSTSLKNFNRNLHSSLENTSNNFNILTKNENTKNTLDICSQTSKNTESKNMSSFMNNEGFVSINSNTQIPTINSIETNNYKNGSNHISFNQNMYSQNVSRDLSPPIIIESFDNLSKNIKSEIKRSDSASNQNFTDTASSKDSNEKKATTNFETSQYLSSNESFNNYRMLSDTHIECIPKNDKNLKHIATSCPENISLNCVYSKFFVPQNFINSVVGSHSEINNSKYTNTYLPVNSEQPEATIFNGVYCNQNTANNVIFDSPQISHNSTVSIHNKLSNSNNTNIHKSQINFEKILPTQTNFLNDKNFENQVCVKIPDRDPSFKCEKGNDQNTASNVKFDSPQISHHSTVSIHNKLSNCNNTNIHKSQINFEKILPTQTNFLNDKILKNQVSVKIPDREPSFQCEQGNVWIEENLQSLLPNKIDGFERNKSADIPINYLENLENSSNCKKNFDKEKLTKNGKKINNNEFPLTHQVLVPQYEMISDDDEANSSLTVQISGDLDTSLNSEEIVQPSKKFKFDNHEKKIQSYQVYRHKKFSKLSLLPEENLTPQHSADKLSCFKQSKKQLLPKSSDIKILKVDHVQYPNVSSLISSPRENSTKNISWRSPLTSEKNMSTPNSSCSSSDVSSPMTMSKLDIKYPSTLRVEDYQTSKASTAHSIVKVNENSSTDIHQREYSIQERKYVVREIMIKTKIDNSSVKSRSNYHKNSADHDNTRRFAHSQYPPSASNYKVISDNYNSMQRNLEKFISSKQEQSSASNYKLESEIQNNIHTAIQDNESRNTNVGLRQSSNFNPRTNFRKNEKLPQTKHIRASSGAVKDSTSFKNTMKDILTQLSDKGASKALHSSSENNDITQELFIPPKIQDYSVRSDLTESNNKTKTQEIFHSKIADAIYKSRKIYENLENTCNDIQDREQKEVQRISSNEENNTSRPNFQKESYSLFKDKDKTKNYQPRDSSDDHISFKFNPTLFMESNYSNSKESINKKITTQTYANETYLEKDSSNFSNNSPNTFFNFKNSHEHENQSNPINCSMPTANRNRNVESHHYSNYVNGTTFENPNKIALRKNFSRHSSNKNLVRLQDGPLVDLKEVNQFLETSNFDHDSYHCIQPMDAHQDNLFNLSPKSFIQTLKPSVSENRFNSKRHNLF